MLDRVDTHGCLLSAPHAAAALAVISSLAVFLPPLVTGHTTLFAVALLPIILSAALRAPFTVTVVYFALVAFRLPEAAPMLLHIGIPKAAGLTLLCALAIKFLISRDRPMEPTPQALLFGGFFIFATLGLATSSLPDAVLETWSDGFIKASLAGVAIALIGTKRSHVSMIAWASILSGSLLAPIVIWNKVYGIGLVEGTRAVVSPGANSILGDPNFTAMLLIIPLGFALAVATLSERSIVRILTGVSCFLLVAAIVATQSRGGLIGLIAILAIVTSMLLRSRTAAAAAAAVAIPVFAALMGLSSRESGGYQEIAAQGLDASASERLIAWKAAWNMAIENPISGVGIGTFKHNFFFYTDEWVGRAMDVHSSWLQVLGETGFVGFVFYILMMASSLAAIHRSAKLAELDGTSEGRILKMHAVGSLAAAVGFCTTATFVSHAISGLAFGIVGISILLLKVSRLPACDDGIAAAASGRRVADPRRSERSVNVVFQSPANQTGQVL